ncbi:MAG: hypothetical protein ACYDDF_05065 [Thermoplasmatota archaeon]
MRSQFARSTASILAVSFVLGAVGAMLPVVSAAGPSSAPYSVVLRYHFNAHPPAILGTSTTTPDTLNTSTYAGSGAQAYRNQTGNLEIKYYVDPALVANLTLAPEVDLHPYMVGEGSGGGQIQATFTVTLFDISSSGSSLVQTQIGSAGPTQQALPDGTPSNLYQAQDVDQAGGLKFLIGNNYTIAPGHTLMVDVVVHPTGQSPTYNLWWDSPFAPTNVVIHTFDTPNPTTVTVTNANTGSTVFRADHGNATVNVGIRAPLGQYDIAAATLNLTGPGNAAILTNTPLAKGPGSMTNGVFPYSFTWPYNAVTPGTYTVTVSALDNSGNRRSTAVSFEVGIHLEAVNLTIVDDHNATIAGMPWKLYSGSTLLYSGTTGSSGNVSLSLTNSSYRFAATFQAVQVVNSTFVVNGRTALTLHATVAYPVLHAVDATGRAAAGIALFVGYPNGTSAITPIYTDTNGNASLGRAAEGQFSVTAWWRGVGVNRTTILVGGDGPFTIHATIYTLVAHIVTPGNATLPGLAVVALDGRGFLVAQVPANASGSASFTLAADTYTLVAEWRGIEINRTVLSLNGSESVNLVAHVFTVPFLVKGRDGLPIEDAQITVGNGVGDLAHVETNASGGASALLPAGSLNFTITWLGIDVGAFAHNVNSTAPILFDVSAGPVQVTVLDASGRPLGDADVSLVAGASQVAGMTNPQGIVTLRIPDGTFAANVTWLGANVYAAALVTQGGTPATIRAHVHTLTVNVHFEDASAASSANVAVVDTTGRQLTTNYTDANGAVSFRLPDGSYKVWARYQGAYLWAGVDLSNAQTLSISADKSVVVTETRPPAYETPVAMVVTLAVVGGLAVGFVIYRMRRVNRLMGKIE